MTHPQPNQGGGTIDWSKEEAKARKQLEANKTAIERSQSTKNATNDGD